MIGSGKPSRQTAHGGRPVRRPSRPASRRPARPPARPRTERDLPPALRWLVTAARTLSLRGRVVLVTGVALLVIAFLTGSQILLRLGTLLVATPLVCLVVVSRARHQLHCSRLVVPGRVPAGDPAQITVRVYNDATTPSSVLLAEDRLPLGLAARTRFVLDRIEPAGHREVVYQTRGRVRGRYPVGPMTVRLADPFGMCERDRPLSGTDDLIVVPVVEPLPALPLTGDALGDDNRPTTLPAAGEDDMCTREYREGDPMHRVHWRSTARRGELMVRREEHPRQNRATVVLDMRAGAHRGLGPESSVEWAVSACASVTAHLARRGFAVRVLTDRDAAMRAGLPEVVPGAPGAEGPLLDALAILETGPDGPLRDLTKNLARPGADSLVIAIVGDLDAQDAEDLSRRRPRGSTAVVFLIRTSTWDRQAKGRPGPDHTPLLRSTGWRTVNVEYGDSLATAWSSALRGQGIAGPAKHDTAKRAAATADGAA